jgi:hypothetical protein
VSLLTILLVLAIPFFSIAQYPEQAGANKPWTVGLLELFSEAALLPVESSGLYVIYLYSFYMYMLM